MKTMTQETEAILSRIDRAIADFEARPERPRWQSVLAALYRQREEIASATRGGVRRADA
jgi:hypothetical protein